jgi:glycosyltransferase involved in cell wall biosynthesis
VFAGLPCRKAILYHNMTPPEFFRGLQEQIARDLQKGREQTKQLAGTAEVVLAVSAFNARELETLGFRDVGVFPLVVDFGRLRTRPNRRTLKQFKDGLVNVLFVGRCVPNKRIEDALAAFYYFQKYVEPRSRFIHVGSFAGTEQYHALTLTVLRDLQLENVELTGAIRQDELVACYRSADLFLCMSEHEGFCIPLIESMVHDVPILAYEAGAVPETLDGAGVLFARKDFAQVAEMMGRLVRDDAFRGAVLRKQRDRLTAYEHRDLAGELKKHLAPLLS